MTAPTDSRTVGRELLGPVFYRFFYQLWLHQLVYAERHATALFLSRGGLRLRHFYGLFLRGNGLQAPCAQGDLYLSRMAVFRAALLEPGPEVSRALAVEYAGYTVYEAMRLFLPAVVFGHWLSDLPSRERARVRATRFRASGVPALLSPSHTGSATLRDHFAQQRAFAREHFADAMQGGREALLVDTGWSGSIVATMQALLPEVPLLAHFFGRYNYGGPAQPWFPLIVGVELEGRDYSPLRPETSLFLHRHLIEGPCEVRWPGVEGFRRDPETGRVVPESGEVPEEARVPGRDEALALGIEDYQRRCDSGLHAARIHSEARSAARRLRRRICYPRPGEALALTVPTRPAGFGKDLDVPVLLPPARHFAVGTKLEHVRRSLWPTGQASLEFPVLHPLAQFGVMAVRDVRWVMETLKAAAWRSRPATRLAAWIARLTAVVPKG